MSREKLLASIQSCTQQFVGERITMNLLRTVSKSVTEGVSEYLEPNLECVFDLEDQKDEDLRKGLLTFTIKEKIKVNICTE